MNDRRHRPYFETAIVPSWSLLATVGNREQGEALGLAKETHTELGGVPARGGI